MEVGSETRTEYFLRAAFFPSHQQMVLFPIRLQTANFVSFSETTSFHFTK